MNVSNDSHDVGHPWSRKELGSQPSFLRACNAKMFQASGQDAKAGGQAPTAEIRGSRWSSSLPAKTPDSLLRNGPAIAPARSRVSDLW